MTGYYYYMGIVPAGYNPAHPVGTGPFKYQSFTPGQQSTFLRNDNYWDSGDGPYVDTLVITDYADETSQVNALAQPARSTLVNLLSATSIPQVQAAAEHPDPPRRRHDAVHDAGRQAAVQRRPRPAGDAADLRPPADDGARLRRPRHPRQRHLLAVRPRVRPLHPAAPPGHRPGQVAAEGGGPGSLPSARHRRHRAGHAQGRPGARAAGDRGRASPSAAPGHVTEFYGHNYLKWIFAQDYWYYSNYLPQVRSATLPNSPFNETHFEQPNATTSCTTRRSPPSTTTQRTEHRARDAADRLRRAAATSSRSSRRRSTATAKT